LSADLELAERAALAAGEALMRRFRGPIQGLDSKTSATDPVSDADREAEHIVRELLETERPEDGLLAEEGSSSESQSGRRWVVDPLDGTVNFLYGIPQFAVSIALEDEQGGLAGVVHDPAREETFRALRGGGAELNGSPIHVSGCERLERAMVATGFSYDSERRGVQAQLLTRVLPRVRDIRRVGAAALDLSWLAAGRFDGYYEEGLKPWDWAAGRLILTEAGGVAEELRGDGPPGLVAANPVLLPELAELTAT
jgi:myo-inositol-1(or 4)-monophosphatase